MGMIIRRSAPRTVKLVELPPGSTFYYAEHHDQETPRLYVIAADSGEAFQSVLPVGHRIVMDAASGMLSFSNENNEVFPVTCEATYS